MRLVATEYLSLDGVFEEPGKWSGPWFNDEAGQFKWDELQASDAQLLGRKTYEGFAAAWPTMEGVGEFGVKMNTMPKYVVSSTLKNPAWSGTQVITGGQGGNRQYIEQEIPHVSSLLCDSIECLIDHADVVVIGANGADGARALAAVRPEQMVVDLTRGAVSEAMPRGTESRACVLS